MLREGRSKSPAEAFFVLKQTGRRHHSEKLLRENPLAMETWRAIMTQGAYSAKASKASRYGVLDDDADKLAQPLILRREADDTASSYASHDDYDSDRGPEWDPHTDDEDDLLERGPMLRPPRVQTKGYDAISLTASPAAVLQSLVTNVLWPMTAVGAQTAKVMQPRCTNTTRSEDRNALRTVTTLHELTTPRRRSETLEDLHERALVRIAVVTLVCSAWLIIAVYRHAA